MITIKDPQAKERNLKITETFYHETITRTIILVPCCYLQTTTIIILNPTGTIPKYMESLKSILTIKNVSSNIPVSVDGITISNPKAVSNVFNKYFSFFN